MLIPPLHYIANSWSFQLMLCKLAVLFLILGRNGLAGSQTSKLRVPLELQITTDPGNHDIMLEVFPHHNGGLEDDSKKHMYSM